MSAWIDLEMMYRQGLAFTLLVIGLTFSLDSAATSSADREAAADEGESSRIFTVEKMLSFATIGDPGVLNWADYDRLPPAYSPDGEHVAVVVRRGVPERAAVEGVLLVLATKDLLSKPAPRRVAVFESTSNGQPIGMVRWLDQDTLVFGATRGDDPTQIYKVTVGNGKLEQLTYEPTSVVWYDVAHSQDRLVVFRKEPHGTRQVDNEACLRSGCQVTARILWYAERGERTWADFGTEAVVYDLRSDTRRVIPGPAQNEERVDRCMLGQFHGGVSPDGRYGVQICDMLEWPTWWFDYQRPGQPTADKPMGLPRFSEQLFLYDLDAGTQRGLSNAPFPWNAKPVWMEGGRLLALVGALETLEGSEGLERSERARSLAVLQLDPQTGGIRRIARLPPDVSAVVAARWDESTRTLIAEFRRQGPKSTIALAWQQSGGTWRATPVPSRRSAAAKRRVELEVEESPNQRPILVAYDSKRQQRATVLDPNPWLDTVRLGKVEMIHWSDSEGRSWRGMLYHPRDYSPGRRYGLVLQTHGIRPSEFSLDGYARNYAAQPLAARGLMVLQVAEDERILDVIGTPAEWPRVQKGYEAAITHLDRRGLIDPKRVGILGWSRTGNHVGYTLVHSEFPFAAAMLMDANDFGWWTYMSWGVHRSIEKNYGSAPFGTGLEQWLKHGAFFSVAASSCAGAHLAERNGHPPLGLVCRAAAVGTTSRALAVSGR